MRLALLILLFVFPFACNSQMVFSSAAADTASQSEPPKTLTVAQWHMYLRTDDVLVFTDGQSTRTFALDAKNADLRSDAINSLLKHLNTIEMKTSMVIITGWHGDARLDARTRFTDLLLQLSYFDGHPLYTGVTTTKRPPIHNGTTIPKPLFSSRYVYGIHNKTSLKAQKRSEAIHVPQSFIDEIPD